MNYKIIQKVSTSFNQLRFLESFHLVRMTDPKYSDPQQIKNEHKAYQSQEFPCLADVHRVWSESICFQGFSCRRCLVRKNVEETG